MKITTMFYLVLLLIPVSTHAQGDVSYIGEYCFDLVSTDTSKPTKTFKVGILSYGSGYSPVHGKATVQGVIMPVHGTAVLDGDSVYMTLNAAGPPLTNNTTTIYLRYYVSTSLGSFNEIYQFVQYLEFGPMLPSVQIGTDSGSVSLHACT